MVRCPQINPFFSSRLLRRLSLALSLSLALLAAHLSPTPQHGRHVHYRRDLLYRRDRLLPARPRCGAGRVFRRLAGEREWGWHWDWGCERHGEEEDCPAQTKGHAHESDCEQCECCGSRVEGETCLRLCSRFCSRLCSISVGDGDGSALPYRRSEGKVQGTDVASDPVIPERESRDESSSCPFSFLLD
jgi:hypothetical protein